VENSESKPIVTYQKGNGLCDMNAQGLDTLESGIHLTVQELFCILDV
jgi:hypothetical protein